MLSIHEHITNISEAHMPLLRKLTDHLQRHFGITYFCYQKVTYDGLWQIVANNPIWLHHSAEKQFYNYDPSLINPKYYRRGIVLPEANPSEILENTLIKDARLFDLRNTLAIIEPVDDGCEFFFFSAPEEHSNIVNIYLQQIVNLKIFTKFFKNNALDVIRLMVDNPVDLKSLKNSLFDIDNNILTDRNDNASSKDFLSDLHSAGSTMITPREQDCLQLLLQGKTAKETGKVLGISPRTVEEYLMNIRQKFNCKSKSDLVKIYLDE